MIRLGRRARSAAALPACPRCERRPPERTVAIAVADEVHVAELCWKCAGHLVDAGHAEPLDPRPARPWGTLQPRTWG